mmetsp:Transcript_44532/g.102816  ORF Transcript_44532/g.102816 Transcript_44532/m.102816 type:complete len:427 (+) Transcript_44532:61-1341(+)
MEVGNLSVADVAPLKSKKAGKSSKSSKTRTSSTNVNIVTTNPEPQAKSAVKQKAKFCMYQLQGVCRYSADECAYSHSMEEMRHARGLKETSSPTKPLPSRMTGIPPTPFTPAETLQRPPLSTKNLAEHAARAPKATDQGSQHSLPSSRRSQQAQWYPEYDHGPSAAAPSLAPNPFGYSGSNVYGGTAAVAGLHLVPPSISAPLPPAPGLGRDLEPMFLSLPPPLDSGADPGVWLPRPIPAPVQAPVARPPPNLLPQQSPAHMATMVADVAKQVALMQEGRLLPEAVQQLSQCISMLTHKVGELTQFVVQEQAGGDQLRAASMAQVSNLLQDSISNLHQINHAAVKSQITERAGGAGNQEPMAALGDFANLVDMTMALQQIQQNLQLRVAPPTSVFNSMDMVGNLALTRALDQGLDLDVLRNYSHSA